MSLNIKKNRIIRFSLVLFSILSIPNMHVFGMKRSHPEESVSAKASLIEAVESGLLQLVKIALYNGADVNEQNIVSGVTPLMVACKKGFESIAQELISNGANLDLQNKYGETALIYASSNGHFNIVKMLIAAGANVNTKNFNDISALMYASQNGNLEIVKELIAAKANVNFASLIDLTPLSIACKNNHIAIVKELIKAGANVNGYASDPRFELGQFSPLMLASLNGYKEIVEELLLAGADLEFKDSVNGQTALMLACSKGHLEIVKILVKKGAYTIDKHGTTVLGLAIFAGHFEIVKELIKSKANLNFPSRIPFGLDFMYPLLLAYEKGHLNIVKDLIQAGANFEATNFKGDTILILASAKGDLDTVKLLIQAGANVNARNNSGETALHEACWKGYLDIVTVLLEANADVNLRNNHHGTPLSFAAYNLDIVKELIKYGAQVNITNMNGLSALSRAIAGGKLQVVKELIKKGAYGDTHFLFDSLGTLPITNQNIYTNIYLNIFKELIGTCEDINAQDDKGFTLLMKFCKRRNLEPIRELLAAGADVNKVSNDGSTALMNACCMGHIEIVKELISAGADINVICPEDGRNLLDHQINVHNSNNIVKLLAFAGVDTSGYEENNDVKVSLNKRNKIFQAAKESNNYEISLYINSKIPFNIRDEHGNTPLHYMVKNNNFHLINVLLQNSYSEKLLNMTNDDGQTPIGDKFNPELLNTAINWGNLDLVKHLLSLPLQGTLESSNKSPLTLLRDYLKLTKHYYDNSIDETARIKYKKIAKFILQRLYLLSQEGLISKSGLNPDGISAALPVEVKLNIERFSNK